jgi:hypothetical protein
MSGSRRRLGLLLVATVAAVIVTCAAASAKSAGRYPPSCPAGAQPGADPPDACVYASYVSNAYTTPLVRQRLSVTHRIVHHGHYSYEVVSVKVGFSDALPECPEGAVPLSDIPCQMNSAGVGMTGRYVRGQPRLETGDIPPGNPATCTPQATHGVCTFDFRLYEDVSHGFYVGVVDVSVGELTKDPTNDLGQAGFEFAVGVNVPRAPALR